MTNQKLLELIIDSIDGMDGDDVIFMESASDEQVIPRTEYATKEYVLNFIPELSNEGKVYECNDEGFAFARFYYDYYRLDSGTKIAIINREKIN